MTLKDNLSSLAINTFWCVELFLDTLPWQRMLIGSRLSRDVETGEPLAGPTTDMLIMASTSSEPKNTYF